LIILKSSEEIEEIKKAAQIAKIVMDRTLGWMHPGLTTLQVDKFVNSQIKAFHSLPSFLGVDGYKFSTCISINNEVVHGMPSNRKIRRGDIVSLDLGVKLNGWNSDMCRTKVADGKKKSDYVDKFLEVGIKALDEAITQVVIGNRVGDISSSIQKSVETAGFNVIRDLTGHAIGRELHEDPMIPCFGKRGTGDVLQEGMVLCVEVMYVAGSPLLKSAKDGWTVSTMDGKISAMFEDMVAVAPDGPKVLTR